MAESIMLDKVKNFADKYCKNKKLNKKKQHTMEVMEYMFRYLHFLLENVIG